MRRWLVIFTIFAVLSSAVTVRADQALDDYNLAVQLYKQNRWAFAVESFRKFIKDYPTHEKLPYARLYLGLTLVNQSDFKAARDELRGFVKDYPQNANLPQAMYRVAECSYLLNDLPAALPELQAYLKVFPDDKLAERAWPYLGDVQLRLNDPAAAATSFATAVQKFPEGALIDDARFGWAKALEAQKQWADALARYRDLTKAESPRAAEAWFQIGNIEFEAQRFAEAAEAYQVLLDKFPANALANDAALNAGFAWYRQANYPAAEKAFVVAAKEPTRALTANYWRALSLKNQGDYKQASTILTGLQSQAGDDPQGEAIQFQLGMCQRLDGDAKNAQTSLLAVVEKYPQGEYADDALHFATEVAIEVGDLTNARLRLDQFAKSFPQSGLRMYQELLAGRLELALAAQLLKDKTDAAMIAPHYNAAATAFSRVMQESTLVRTKSQAQYYLALTKQLQGEHQATIDLAKPLVDQVLSEESSSEFTDILVVQADSLVQLEQYASAQSIAANYLQRVTQGRQRLRAWSLLAVAQSEQGDGAAALTSLEQMQKEEAKSPLIGSTLLRMAERADARKDWATAGTLYQRLLPLAKGAENEVYALRGLAWANYQQQQFSLAAEHFQKLIQQFPQHALAVEAAYYYAECLREQGQLAEAAKAFVTAFQQTAPPAPAAPKSELEAPYLYAFRAGLQAARTYRQAQLIEEADKTYAEVLTRFPQPANLDRVLDEWALLNYDAERFDRADEIFRRLVKETPDSDLADNAALSLAESDLIANKLEAAQQSFEQLWKSPKSDDLVRERALYQLVVLALDTRRWSDVLTLTSEFRTAFPQSPSGHYVEYAATEAVLADPQAKPDQLESVLKQLASMTQAPVTDDPWLPRVWVLAAEAQFRLKRYDEVATTVADLKRKLPEAPLNYQADEILGRTLKQQARFPEAREALERVVAAPAAFRTETAAKSQFLIAETWLLQEKWKDAFLAYQKVYASYAYPEWQAAALLQSGVCDERLGNWKDAAATYQRLLAEFPNSMHVDEARKKLAEVQKRIGGNS